MELSVTVLGSGSGGNAALVRRGRTALLVDAGLAARDLAARLEACGQEPHRLDALLITHEHGDHVRGAAVFSRRFKVPVMSSPDSRAAAGRALDRLAAWEPLQGGVAVGFADLSVRPFPLPHDAACTFGFEVEGGGLRYAHATDLGHANRLVVERMRGAHLLLLEMNYDPWLLREGPYPWPVKQRILSRHGHLSNDAAAGALPRLVGPETRAVFLAHISETNNEPGLALAAARMALGADGAQGPALHLARQDRPSETARV